jgi:hypothetical protein
VVVHNIPARTANAIVNSVTASHLEGCGSADGALPNCSDLEARLMAEVALAASLEDGPQ